MRMRNTFISDCVSCGRQFWAGRRVLAIPLGCAGIFVLVVMGVGLVGVSLVGERSPTQANAPSTTTAADIVAAVRPYRVREVMDRSIACRKRFRVNIDVPSAASEIEKLATCLAAAVAGSGVLNADVCDGMMNFGNGNVMEFRQVSYCPDGGGIGCPGDPDGKRFTIEAECSQQTSQALISAMQEAAKLLPSGNEAFDSWR